MKSCIFGIFCILFSFSYSYAQQSRSFTGGNWGVCVGPDTSISLDYTIDLSYSHQTMIYTTIDNEDPIENVTFSVSKISGNQTNFQVVCGNDVQPIAESSDFELSPMFGSGGCFSASGPNTSKYVQLAVDDSGGNVTGKYDVITTISYASGPKVKVTRVDYDAEKIVNKVQINSQLVQLDGSPTPPDLTTENLVFQDDGITPYSSNLIPNFFGSNSTIYQDFKHLSAMKFTIANPVGYSLIDLHSVSFGSRVRYIYSLNSSNDQQFVSSYRVLWPNGKNSTPLLVNPADQSLNKVIAPPLSGVKHNVLLNNPVYNGVQQVQANLLNSGLYSTQYNPASPLAMSHFIAGFTLSAEGEITAPMAALYNMAASPLSNESLRELSLKQKYVTRFTTAIRDNNHFIKSYQRPFYFKSFWESYKGAGTFGSLTNSAISFFPQGIHVTNVNAVLSIADEERLYTKFGTCEGGEAGEAVWNHESCINRWVGAGKRFELFANTYQQDQQTLDALEMCLADEACALAAISLSPNSDIQLAHANGRTFYTVKTNPVAVSSPLDISLIKQKGEAEITVDMEYVCQNYDETLHFTGNPATCNNF